MKKILLFGAMAALAFSASAQRANDADASWMGDGQPSSYNLIGVSYDNTHLGFHDGDDSEGLGLNGFGLEYTHGFGLSSAYPMYLELGFKWNMGFGSKSYDDDYESEKIKYQMMRLDVPVSYAWRFIVSDSFSVTPYTGLDFRFNAMGKTRSEYNDNGDSYKTDWANLFDKDDMGDETWNRFQMGWHVGVRAEYSRAFLGVSYGTDFIHAYKDGDYHVSTGNLAVTLGYRF